MNIARAFVEAAVPGQGRCGALVSVPPLVKLVSDAGPVWLSVVLPNVVTPIQGGAAGKSEGSGPAQEPAADGGPVQRQRRAARYFQRAAVQGKGSGRRCAGRVPQRAELVDGDVAKPS